MGQSSLLASLLTDGSSAVHAVSPVTGSWFCPLVAECGDPKKTIIPIQKNDVDTWSCANLVEWYSDYELRIANCSKIN